ncbi:MAG: hypothetical protein JXA33_01815 [Anaerolineae bacterium]|nr:hypothetical protein [Anaerolineae bacterium]
MRIDSLASHDQQKQTGGDYDGSDPATIHPLPRSWYGIRQVWRGDFQTVADNLRGSILVVGVPDTYGADLVNGLLNQVQDYGYRAVVIMNSDTTCSRRPWEWDGNTWVFPPTTVLTLQGISAHPALFAIYALHEPFDTTNVCHWTVEQHQELYQLLKAHTNGVPVWSDIQGVDVWKSQDIVLADGICDYCGTFYHRFRSDWTSEQCLEAILNWIDADLNAQRRLMPNSQIVFQIQVYAYANYIYPLRLPTVEELETVRDHLCTLNQPFVYYLWSHDTYDVELKDAPELWPVVSQGCLNRYYYSYLPVLNK